MANTSVALLVAAIDIGTTYSGWAFSLKSEFDKDPTSVQTKVWTQLLSNKGPTCILIRPDGKTIEAFAYEAENRYTELCENGEHKKWYFFRRFKMALWNKPIHKDTMIDDECGRKLPALTVFSLSIRYMKEDVEKTYANRVTTDLKQDNVRWVLTVPAIWNDSAKQFMRFAAEQAGIKTDKLYIALEPEAASLYCRHSNLLSFQTGQKYLVLDAGGGTIDIAVHEVCDGGSIKEIYRPSGGDWGGTNVDEAFIKFLREIAGNDAIQRFKDENVEEYLDLLRDFEAKKRGTDAASKTNITIKIPPTLFGIVQGMTQMSLQDKLQASSYEKTVTLTKTNLRLDAEVMRSFVCENLLQMIQHTSDLLERPECKNVEAILMVGGFSESKFLQEMFKLNFKLPPIVPPKAGLAVLIGAVIYGHRPTAITERKSIYTYGIKSTADYNDKIHPLSKRSVFKDGSVLCVDVFSIIVREGDTLVVGRVHNERSYFPIYESQKVMIIPIFTSRDRNSKFTTDPGCKQVGSLQVPLAGIGTDRSVTVRMLFGGTEIIVECVEEATKRIRRLNIDFLTY